MLKLVGTLRNGPSRISGRSTNWCMPNHQMLAGCSGAAAAPQPNVDLVLPSTPKVPKEVPKPEKPEVSETKNTLVKKAFTAIKFSNSEPTSPKGKENSIEDLLSSVKTKVISYKEAVHTITRLAQEVDNGNIDLKTLESDERYKMFCKIIKKRSPVANAMKNSEWGGPIPRKGVSEDDFQESADVTALSLVRSIQIFCGLAVRQRRPRPLLRNLADNIIKDSTSLSIKNIADIVYAMARLNFIEEDLLVKLTKDLKTRIPEVEQSPIIGSILTSLGMMRYRDDDLMDTLCDWTVKHKKAVRTQDLCALLMTLAVIGYSPRNFDILYRDLVCNLKDTEMTKVLEWVDVVWSLVILNQASNEHMESVLNQKFITTLTDRAEIPISKQHKLLNINAAAKYLFNNYSGPFLEESSPAVAAPIIRIKDKEMFVTSITDALANLFPSRDYFRSSVDARTGFLIDVDFYVDNKLMPIPANKVNENTNALRIAIIANHYHDYSVGKKSILGSGLLHNRLLEAMGYRILDISHTDFHTDDKLLNRISYLNDRIKTIVK